MTDHDIALVMAQLGGSFAQALAKAFMVADAHNQCRIKTAFPDLWEQYAELAELKRART